MLITTGILKSKLNILDKTCTVHVPLFDNPGDSFPDDKDLTNVPVMLPPGTYGGYSNGDEVIIGFVENSYNKPIVLGKIFKADVRDINADSIDVKNVESDQLLSTLISCDELTATKTASIPFSTKISYPAEETTTEGGAKVAAANDSVTANAEAKIESLDKLIEKVNSLTTQVELLTNILASMGFTTTDCVAADSLRQLLELQGKTQEEQ